MSVILEILARHIRDLAPFLFVVTSRPKPHIVVFLEKANELSLKNSTKLLVLHNVHLASVQGDIRWYLSDGFRKISMAFSVDEGWPSTQDIDALAKLSQGLFIFATTALRFIEDKFPQNQLQTLLTASVTIVHDLYLAVLDAAFGNTSNANSANKRLHRALGAITFAEEPNSTLDLARLLGAERA